MTKIFYRQVIVIFLFFLFFGAVHGALAANLQNAFGNSDSPLEIVAGPGGAGYKTGDTDISDTIIGNIIAVILSFVGVVFLILMIYGGFTWMLARGNEQEVERAKKMITAAIIGMIIVFAAYAISYLLVHEVGKSTLQGISS